MGDWAAWARVTPVALVNPGALGLQLIYEGVPVEVRRADDEWRHCANVLRDWRGAQFADGAHVVVGTVGAVDGLTNEAAVLWATEWPWPEATVELPCPGGVLLIVTGTAGDLGSELAQ